MSFSGNSQEVLNNEATKPHAATEVLYAMADMLSTTEDINTTDMLANNLNCYITEEGLKFLLTDTSLSIGCSIVGNTIRIAANANTSTLLDIHETLSHIDHALQLFAGNDTGDQFEYDDINHVLEIRLESGSYLNELFMEVEKLRASDQSGSPMM